MRPSARSGLQEAAAGRSLPLRADGGMRMAAPRPDVGRGLVTRMAWVRWPGLAGVAVAAGVLGWSWWNAHWPPRVYDHELARIGPPVPGARPLGGPFTSAGSVTCIDECLIQAQSYRASGLLSVLAGEAAAHLSGKGYQGLAGALRSEFNCVQNGPPVFSAGYYELSCYLHSHTQKLAVSVEFRFAGDAPFVPMPSDSDGTYYLAAGAVPALMLTPQNAQIIVSVQSASSAGSDGG
jgi:hypothetical protein